MRKNNSDNLVMKNIKFFLILSSAIIFTGCGRTKIAFYGLSDNVKETLKAQILEVEPKAKFLEENTAKCDILFTWNGKIADQYGEKTKVPEKFKPLFPSNIPTQNYLPVLLDHGELSFYRTFRNDMKLEIPANYAGLMEYLSKIKKKVPYPMVCAGANDKELSYFISCFSLSFLGKDNYLKMAKDISNAGTNGEFPQEFKNILDELKRLSSKELLHPMWYKASTKDVNFFMKEHLVGGIAMSLSEHREKEFVFIKYYDTSTFPFNKDANTGVICPAVCALPFSEKHEVVAILTHLFKTETETEMSQKTKLAPTILRAESYDRQADDVRFWAAATPGGPLPDLATKCFATVEEQHNFSEKIRSYFE